MAKRQAFADKANKVKLVKICPVCEGAITPTLLVKTVKNKRGGLNYKQHRVGICKCNQKELLG
ncbi:MAG: hypothetical protein GF307_10910 [candidate division Zixibacteria bacterium]|nr:hypothetical protein [candidate division Zixibacteria bacterium]